MSNPVITYGPRASISEDGVPTMTLSTEVVVTDSKGARVTITGERTYLKGPTLSTTSLCVKTEALPNQPRVRNVSCLLTESDKEPDTFVLDEDGDVFKDLDDRKLESAIYTVMMTLGVYSMDLSGAVGLWEPDGPDQEDWRTLIPALKSDQVEYDYVPGKVIVPEIIRVMSHSTVDEEDVSQSSEIPFYPEIAAEASNNFKRQFHSPFIQAGIAQSGRLLHEYRYTLCITQTSPEADAAFVFATFDDEDEVDMSVSGVFQKDNTIVVETPESRALSVHGLDHMLTQAFSTLSNRPTISVGSC